MRPAPHKRLSDRKPQPENKMTLEFDRKTFTRILLALGFAILLYWGLNHTEKLTTVFGSLLRIIAPFLLGLCLAFVINVLLRPLEKLWDKIFRKKTRFAPKLKRPVCILLSTLIMLGFVFALLFMIFPQLNRTVTMITNNMPQYIDGLEVWWNKCVELASGYGIVLPEFSLNADEILNTVTSFLKENNSKIINMTVGITSSIFTGLVNTVLGFVFALYVLSQKEKLCRNVKSTLSAFCPEKRARKILNFATLTNQTFTNFVTGQLTEAMIIGALCFVGMLIFRMPYAAVISLLVAFTALIPVFGAFIGTGIGALLILMEDPMKALWFIIFIIVLQQFEGDLIYPRVVGKSVGLPGIWVLVAVTIGGSAFGITGMLFSVPVCAVLYTVLKQTVSARTKAPVVAAPGSDPG